MLGVNISLHYCIPSAERGNCPIAAVCTVQFYCPDVKP